VTERGKSGHAVVVFGYDTDPKMVLLCLWWGSLFREKWLDYYSIQDRILFFTED
jgi:hypothetical protein